MTNRPTEYCETHEAWAVLVRPFAWVHSFPNKTVFCRLASEMETEK